MVIPHLRLPSPEGLEGLELNFTYGRENGNGVVYPTTAFDFTLGPAKGWLHHVHLKGPPRTFWKGGFRNRCCDARPSTLFNNESRQSLTYVEGMMLVRCMNCGKDERVPVRRGSTYQDGNTFAEALGEEFVNILDPLAIWLLTDTVADRIEAFFDAMAHAIRGEANDVHLTLREDRFREAVRTLPEAHSGPLI